jgi:hypothetical protein
MELAQQAISAIAGNVMARHMEPIVTACSVAVCAWAVLGASQHGDGWLKKAAHANRVRLAVAGHQAGH